jgi:hypothetical protein
MPTTVTVWESTPYSLPHGCEKMTGERLLRNTGAKSGAVPPL